MTHPPSGGADKPSDAGGSPQHAATGQPPRRRRPRSLLIASLALVGALLLCGGGGTVAFLALRDTEDGTGASEPAVAVDDFLTAVYQQRSVSKASALVCSSSRDERKIAAKIAEVERYVETYREPRFRWTTPTVANETGDRATVTTKVSVSTADERVAEQDLRFTVVRRTGWWVCEVS
ncbi:hypothetical protein K7640_26670 [Micromonospora sp. PLK6-60]|uniref:Rv0361 family membrane protein n=1 Tax=Micromonospora sp. PLK6-60 TaxID=2873383 RepID=UPI001CA61B30|nr:hypothetical protein [Micromonospora sp. PLK6-60]MBY8875424.1 hypothetical protein [Micromonospora sp. PLK6-60]